MAMIQGILFFTIFSFIISYITLPKLIKSLIKNGLFGRDVHKINKPRVAEPGGIVLIFSFVFSILIYLAIITYTDGVVKNNLLAGTLSIMIAGIIGLVDDILNFRWRTKFLIAFLPALPLMVLKAGVSEMYIPLLGYINFGVFYSLLLIPLMVNFAINEFNMVAGYNGLESGMAIVSMITVLIASILTDNVDVAILVSCMFGGTIAFFLFNKYPAKVFPGDTGTFLFGATLIVSLIIGNMEKLALGVFFLYFIDFLMFLVCLKERCFKKFKAKFAKIDSQERLHPTCWHRTYYFLPYFFPQWNLKERDITRILVGAQAIICLISLLIFF